MIGGHAIGQSVRTAGILGDVAADGAGALAGWIGRVKVAAALNGERDVQIDHAGLDNGALIVEVDFEDAVHAREGDHEPALERDRAAGQSGARAAADHRHIELARQAGTSAATI